MKLLIDENLSPRLAHDLADLFPGSAHVRDVGLKAGADPLVWDFALQNDFIILSKDADMHDLSLLKGSPPKVVWLRVGNGPTVGIANLLRTRLADVQAFAADPSLALLALP